MIKIKILESFYLNVGRGWPCAWQSIVTESPAALESTSYFDVDATLGLAPFTGSTKPRVSDFAVDCQKKVHFHSVKDVPARVRMTQWQKARLKDYFTCEPTWSLGQGKPGHRRANSTQPHSLFRRNLSSQTWGTSVRRVQQVLTHGIIHCYLFLSTISNFKQFTGTGHVPTRVFRSENWRKRKNYFTIPFFHQQRILDSK